MYKQINLPYNYRGLEPYIDAFTVETHYGKHYMTYTNNLNVLAKKAGMDHLPIASLLENLDWVKNEALRTGLRNNAGGHYNHGLYFSILGPGGSKTPVGKLGKKIDETYGGYDEFVERMSVLAMSVFGSGWAWLSVTPSGELVTSVTANQDNPISLKTGNIPIFCIDVWEHAYYLKYRNLRSSYLKAFFNTVNWDKVDELYREALDAHFLKGLAKRTEEFKDDARVVLNDAKGKLKEKNPIAKAMGSLRKKAI